MQIKPLRVKQYNTIQHYKQGRIQDFKLGGALKEIVWVFRVKNHDFTPKNHIFSNCGGRRENVWGISCEKSRFYAKKSYFFQFYTYIIYKTVQFIKICHSDCNLKRCILSFVSSIPFTKITWCRNDMAGIAGYPHTDLIGVRSWHLGGSPWGLESTCMWSEVDDWI